MTRATRSELLYGPGLAALNGFDSNGSNGMDPRLAATVTVLRTTLASCSDSLFRQHDWCSALASWSAFFFRQHDWCLDVVGLQPWLDYCWCPALAGWSDPCLRQHDWCSALVGLQTWLDYCWGLMTSFRQHDWYSALVGLQPWLHYCWGLTTQRLSRSEPDCMDTSVVVQRDHKSDGFHRIRCHGCGGVGGLVLLPRRQQSRDGLISSRFGSAWCSRRGRTTVGLQGWLAVVALDPVVIGPAAFQLVAGRVWLLALKKQACIASVHLSRAERCVCSLHLSIHS